MASRIIICSSVRPWALLRPGIMEWPQSKIHGRVPHPLEPGLKPYMPVVKKLQTKTNPKKKSASISYIPYYCIAVNALGGMVDAKSNWWVCWRACKDGEYRNTGLCEVRDHGRGSRKAWADRYETHETERGSRGVEINVYGASKRIHKTCRPSARSDV